MYRCILKFDPAILTMERSRTIRMKEHGVSTRPSRYERALDAVPVPREPGNGTHPPDGIGRHRDPEARPDRTGTLGRTGSECAGGLATRRTVSGHRGIRFRRRRAPRSGASHRAVVVTNDQPLLDRLRAAGIPRIFLRSRNHLVAEGL